MLAIWKRVPQGSTTQAHLKLWPANALKKRPNGRRHVPLMALIGLVASCAEAQSPKGRDLAEVQLTEARYNELKELDRNIRDASRRGDVTAFQRLVAPGGISCMDGMAPRAAVVAAMADPKSVAWKALFGKMSESSKPHRGDEPSIPSFQAFFARFTDDQIDAYISFDDPGRNVALLKWTSRAGDVGPSLEFLRRNGNWFMAEWRPVCYLAKF